MTLQWLKGVWFKMLLKELVFSIPRLQIRRYDDECSPGDLSVHMHCCIAWSAYVNPNVAVRTFEGCISCDGHLAQLYDDE